MIRRRGSGALAAAVTALVAPAAFLPADAIPAFQRQTGLACRNCHTLAPVLNRFGQRFLDNGYRLTRDWVRREKASEVQRAVRGAQAGATNPPGALPRPDAKHRTSYAERPSWLPVSLRLRLNGLAEQPEETLEFKVASFSLEIGLPFAGRASFWTDFFLRTGRENARLGDVIVGYYGLLGDRVDVKVGQLSPPLLIESQRRLLIDLPDVYARGSLVNGWFLARRRLGTGAVGRWRSLQSGIYLFQEDTDSDLDAGRPDWAGTLDWAVDPFLTVQLYGYLGDVIVRPIDAASFRDKFRQGTVSIDYLRGLWHLFGAYSTGWHDNADGTGLRSTNAGFFVEANWHPRPNTAAILRVDHSDNPLFTPRRVNSVTLGFSRRVLEERLRWHVEYRLREGRDNDRVAVELELNL